MHALHAISVSDWNEVCPLSVAASVSTSNVLASAPPLSGLHSTDCSLLRQSVSIDLHARPANSRIRGYTDRSSLGRAGLTVLSNTQLVWIWLVVRVGISVGWLHMSSCLFFVPVFFSPFQPLSRGPAISLPRAHCSDIQPVLYIDCGHHAPKYSCLRIEGTSLCDHGASRTSSSSSAFLLPLPLTLR